MVNSALYVVGCLEGEEDAGRSFFEVHTSGLYVHDYRRL